MVSSKNKYSIRRSEDELTIRYLHSETFPTDEFYDSDYPMVYWIAWCGIEPIGFAILGLWDDGTCFLARAGLIESARGKGLHKRLITARENYAKKNNYSAVITYTIKDNYSSMNNLASRGYKLYEPEYPYAADNCMYFIKEINNEERD